MVLTEKLLSELQKRLKIGSRRSVHLNALPARSRYKFDISRLALVDKKLPDRFINALLTHMPMKFRISWKDTTVDLNSLLEEEQQQLVRITDSFEYLVNQTEAIEQEKGINTFGFGFPLLIRRDKKDGQLTVAPILIWSLRIRRTKEFNTWEVLRNDDDPVYINEVLINYLENDSGIIISQIPHEKLDHGLISREELLDLCIRLIRSMGTFASDDIKENFRKKLENIVPIKDKKHYESLPLTPTNVLVEFGGLFSIFEVQKQNVINDYNSLAEMVGLEISLDDMENHTFQSISSVETDPSQQSILRSLETSRNILIQGPPGTGKSQTLTAILVNALENDRKTIVVCEKRTALEVLYNALVAKGLKGHCILVRDIVKDRRAVVDSVRERVDSPGYRRYIYGHTKDELNNITAKAKSLIDSINKKHRKLDSRLIGNRSWTDVVGNLLAELRGCSDDVNLNLNQELFVFDSGELEALLAAVQKGQKLYGDYNEVKEYSFINSDKFAGDNPFVIEQQIGKDFEEYTRLLNRIRQLFDAVRTDYFKLRKSELKSQTHLIESDITAVNDQESELEGLIITAREEYFAFRNNEFHQQIIASEELIIGIDRILSRNGGNHDLTDTVKVSGLGFRVAALFSKRKRQTVADQKELLELLDRLQTVIDGCRDLCEIRISGDLTARKTAFESLKRHIDTTKDVFPSTTQKEFESLELHSVLNAGGRQTALQAIHDYINLPDISQPCSELLYTFKERIIRYLNGMDALFVKLSQDLSTCRDFNPAYTFGDEFSENRTRLPEIKNQLKAVSATFQVKIESEFAALHLLKHFPDEIKLPHLLQLRTKIAELAQRIVSDRWSRSRIESNDPDKFIASVDALIHRKNSYFNSDKDIFIPEFRWFQFYGALDTLHRLVIDELKSKSNWRKTILVFYLNALLLRHASVDLPSGDEEHQELNAVLSNMEREQIKYIKQLWLLKQTDKARRFMLRNNLSVGNLYNKRSSQNFKRLSLRQIVQKDADLFTAFFPIILTSPDVACSLFKGMNGYFDIVMFDEASQLRLEDNLPALLKGKQIVVAGDEHQMPPSNYFSKVFDGSVEDEGDMEEEGDVVIDKDNLYLSCESLIDFASELNFNRKYLDFHYRSRHPYLIDFSNYAFYNQRLKPLPNNFDYIPIKYIQVNGTFTEYTNDAEAETVLSIIDRNIHRLPSGKYPTVGIATFNITQRNLIIRKIQERQKFDQYEVFNTKVQELLTDGMFVKNLENIQGDERDVIILSTTYGVTPEGKFAQRFGPINHSKGYKLLNVIITRAKYKIYVCSSIPENMFMHYRDFLASEGANNRRAVLYAYLAYCKAVSEKDDISRNAVLTSLAENTGTSVSFESHWGNSETESPFEKEVYNALSEYLDTDKLILQMPFAGFRIDLVYDPGIPGVPKIAIECDGAKFHSGPEAYLHDMHRQKILERYGFIFHRTWSTNWWRNPKKEVNRLVEFIKQVELSTMGAVKAYSDYAEVFTDEAR